MTAYTQLSIEEVKSILSRFGIEGIVDHQVLTGGSQNSNYVVSNADQKYVLTICEQSSSQEMEDLVQLLEHLRVNNFSTSIPFQTVDGQLLSNWDDKPVMLKHFIHGHVTDDIPAHQVQLIGVELGQLHQVPPPDYIPNFMSFGKEYFFQVAQYAEGSDYHLWINKMQEYIEAYISPLLPKALIHSDVFTSNVIIDDDEKQVTIMDFEEATHYYRVFDIGMTIIGICREGTGINFEKSTALLQGYRTEINMTQEEINGLQAFVVYAATAMSFWRHKNFNYTIPTPAMFDHYLELKTIADSIHQIHPKDFLHQLGM